MNLRQLILLLFLLGVAVAAAVCYPQIEPYLSDQEFLSKFFEVTSLGTITLYALLGNLSVFAIVSAIEIGFVGWKASSLKRLLTNRKSSTLTDIWCWLLSIFGLYRLFGLILSFGVFYLLVGVMYKYVEPVNLNSIFDNVYLQFALVFILSDLKVYIWHFFMHRRPFWELHKLHHSATEFNIITNSRVHFLEIAIGMVFDAGAFLLLGMPAEFYVIFVYIKELHASLLHSNVRHSFGWIGKYLIVSPNGHRIHHSLEERHHNKNFGAMFTWWDQLFGTFYVSDEPIEIGVDDASYNSKGFWNDVFTGIRAFVKSGLRL